MNRNQKFTTNRRRHTIEEIDNHREIRPDSEDNLYNSELILNFTSIFGTERWGYSRYGLNRIYIGF